MKKKLAILCCLVISVLGLALTGCGGKDLSGSPYLGTWDATTAEYNGLEMSVADILGGNFTFILNGDGTATVMLPGSDEQSGEWDETDNGIKLEGDDSLTFTDEDGILTLDYEGVTLHFEKVE